MDRRPWNDKSRRGGQDKGPRHEFVDANGVCHAVPLEGLAPSKLRKGHPQNSPKG